MRKFLAVKAIKIKLHIKRRMKVDMSRTSVGKFVHEGEQWIGSSLYQFLIAEIIGRAIQLGKQNWEPGVRPISLPLHCFPLQSSNPKFATS